MEFVSEESNTDGMEYCREIGRERRIVGAVTSLVNVRNLHLEYEGLLVLALKYRIKAMAWKEKET